MEVNYPKSGTRIKHILTLSDSPLKKNRSVFIDFDLFQVVIT